MKFVRFATPEGGSWGRIDGDVIRELDGPPYLAHKETGRTQLSRHAELLAPVVPKKILGVMMNYAGLLQKYPNVGSEPPTEPSFFHKAVSALAGPEDPIVLEPGTHDNVLIEAEMAIVIGKTAKSVEQADALNYVFGLTIVNDVTDATMTGSGVARGKSFDTFCPVGPYLVTELEPNELSVRASLNGEEKVRGSTAEMVFSTEAIISTISHVMTLEPGDLIHTGTPGIELIKPGDLIEIEIEGLGCLKNPVVAG
jgi:2-keto-4-pentenoate hydratase/2-oxohepta-3-ene-1,7-dioic acid hydratase in catechol pathway